MIEYVVLALLGYAVGVVTGLIPGVHVNTVAVMGFSFYLASGANPLHFAVFITAVSISHAFISYLPSIFLGAPSEETALSILPAHRLFMDGKALEAVKLTGTGCLLGLLLSVILIPPALYVLPVVYHASRPYIAYVLIAAIILLFANERQFKRIKWAVLIFFLSGWLGFVALDRQRVLASGEILFPIFCGLFGLSNLLDSIRSASSTPVPQDEFIRVGLEPRFIGAGLIGALSGAIIGVLPAISPSQIGALISTRAKFDSRNFLVFLSAISTSDAVYSTLALYTIHNARSGVAVLIGKIIDVNSDTVMLLVGVMAFTAVFSLIAHIELGRRMAGLVGLVDYRLLCAASMLFMLAMICLLTGVFGLLVAVLATALGLLPIYSGVSRTHLMGVLLVPTILYFLGLP